MNFKNLTMRKLAQMNLLLLALASCSVFDLPCTRACSSEQQITYARESAWIILGETTQNDIRTVLGEPTQKVKSSQGNDSWLYLWETEPYLVEMDEEGTMLFGIEPQIYSADFFNILYDKGGCVEHVLFRDSNGVVSR